MADRARTRLAVAAVVVLALSGLTYAAIPYLRAASLLVRVTRANGALGAWATRSAEPVTRHPRQLVPTRYGDVPAQVYAPDGPVHRSVLLVPGIHSMGIEEPRLTSLASDLAATGVAVMALALPDLQAYRITPKATDVIEDAVSWMTRRSDLAPDGRVGLVGISFAGGLSISAAGRPAIRDRVAYVLSFGGHGDLPRVMRYLATGEAVHVPGLVTHPPHDYGVAVILFALADRGIVPPAQVDALREGVRTFLLASQLTLVSQQEANATFAKAREMAKAMPLPARTYMEYVNDRAVSKLGPVLVPFLAQLGSDDPALSPQRAEPPGARVFLLHGDEDTVIPAAETAVLGASLRERGADVRVLLSHIITHAELDRTADWVEVWRLVSFWADLLAR